MPNALYTGVSGLLANQRQLDVVGHNIANMNTTGYKAQRTLFADLFYQTIKPATSASDAAGGGTNPNQIGGGVKAGSIDRKFGQGNLELTGGLFDFAMDGDGFFVLNDGTRDIFRTRAGTFSLDSTGIVVDSVTGNRVQRFGNAGEGDGANPAFQTPGDSSIRVPLGMTIAGNATSNVALAGNLWGQSETAKLISSSFTSGKAPATVSTLLSSLDGNEPAYAVGGSIEISGTNADGSPMTPATYTVDATSTLGNLMSFIDGVAQDATTELDAYGRIFLVADTPGKALQFSLTLSDANSSTPIQELQTAAEGKSIDELPRTVDVFDSQGGKHTMTLEFKKRGNNVWDMEAMLAPADGIVVQGGAVAGITFEDNGNFLKVDSTGLSYADVEVQFDGISSPQQVRLDFGANGSSEGLTQFEMTPTLKYQQDGFSAGALDSISVRGDGMLFAKASNGSIFPIAQLAIASFQNRKGLAAVGNNAFEQSLNSGPPQIGGHQGTVKAGQLESSNVDIAYEFTQLIVAQRGFSANAQYGHREFRSSGRTHQYHPASPWTPFRRQRRKQTACLRAANSLTYQPRAQRSGAGQPAAPPWIRVSVIRSPEVAVKPQSAALGKRRRKLFSPVRAREPQGLRTKSNSEESPRTNGKVRKGGRMDH